MSDTWTIGELAEHAARALRAGAPSPPNGRVRDVPGERLIRWYTTIGLVDPPLTRRGRVARYGRRHLLQLVAVKRLQAAGRSIAEIQAALAGATDRMLEAAARLEAPPHAPDGLPATHRPDDLPAAHGLGGPSASGPSDVAGHVAAAA
ncbi:MerR family transcriptional regulator, partial [Nonomuraea thailandensis]|uniref:helix-turn-helix domain-containing protein n=1 Tax=Nonomuraea thailandensis TaxID=1188745 RepID=UPI003612ADEB